MEMWRLLASATLLMLLLMLALPSFCFTHTLLQPRAIPPVSHKQQQQQQQTNTKQSTGEFYKVRCRVRVSCGAHKWADAAAQLFISPEEGN
jgi:hypothetical protein